MSVSTPAVEGSITEMGRRLSLLEERLSVVEKRLGVGGDENATISVAQEEGAEPAAAFVANPGGAAVLVGKTLFGLALAYLLRALTENQTLTISAGVALGLLYAMAWLVWAARTQAEETFTLGLRAATSVMILLPLLWEATIRFSAISSWTAGGVVTLFAVFGLVISWRKNLTAVAWLTSLAAVLACIGLLARTHDPVPYTAALLLLAAAIETSACLEHYLGERWVVALATNLAVLFMTYIATRPAGTLATYPPIAASVAIALLTLLPAIYLVSTIVRTIGRSRSISSFEVGQCVLAFLIAAWGSIQVGQSRPAVILTVGGFCLAASVACYFVTFAFLERHAEKHRNFHVYAAFGLVLALAGTGLLLNGTPLAAVLSGLAVLFVLAGMNSGRVTLKLHAAAYIVLAVIGSGLADATNTRLLGGGGHAGPATGLGSWIAAASALLCYALLLRGKSPEHAAAPYLGVSTVLAATAAWSVAGVAALTLAPLCLRPGAGQTAADYCPTALTVILVVCCLATAYGARRLARRELTWVSVGLAGVGGYKLAIQDMHEATAFGVVISLMAYGAALSFLPRLVRWTHANLTGASTR